MSRRFLDEIQAKARTQFRTLSRDDLRMREIKEALHQLHALIDQVKHEFDRLDDLARAFHPDNLKRIVDWTNDNVEEERRSSLLFNRKHAPGYGRYVALGSSISVRYSPAATVSLPAYRVPKRTLIDCLTEARTLRFEP